MEIGEVCLMIEGKVIKMIEDLIGDHLTQRGTLIKFLQEENYL